MSDDIAINKGEIMNDVDVQLLKAIHKVEKQVIGLETKIDDSVNGRFKDNERRITNIEANISKLTWAVISSVIAAIMALILK